MKMKRSSVDLAVLLDDDKVVSGNVEIGGILAIQEDPDDEHRCYILLVSGHTMHVEVDFSTLKKWINEDN